jgi:hypothetical protein
MMALEEINTQPDSLNRIKDEFPANSWRRQSTSH